MGYSMLKHVTDHSVFPLYSMEKAVIDFIRNRCEKLRYDFENGHKQTGKSLKLNQIPYNMEMDLDRLCFENAMKRFLKSGKKEDAFDIYFSYLHMFVGDYEKTRRMIELLSEFEMNGSELLMKHRDHYVHSVYVFALGLAIYENNEKYRNVYKKIYGIEDEQMAAHHFMQYWGLASLFHDIGYPFELPFEQVASYFEINDEKRSNSPFIAYCAMEKMTQMQEELKLENRIFTNTDQLFAYLITDKLKDVYDITEEKLLQVLQERVTQPQRSNYFMDHAYFSATIVYKKLFEEMNCTLKMAHLDALTAILLHNSLYKFEIAHIRDEKNVPFKMELHPLAYMLMLCDELQCWDRVSYGRNSKKELHPMGCSFDFSNNGIKATYLYDYKQEAKIISFKNAMQQWQENKEGKKPTLKAYSKMYVAWNEEKSEFQKDIERIVDVSNMMLHVDTKLDENSKKDRRNYLSNSGFMNLHNFAIILNGRWSTQKWKEVKRLSLEEQYLKDDELIQEFRESFKDLSLEYKLSNINQAKAFAKYMNELHCFYTDKEVDFDFVEEFNEEEMEIIGILEHQRWLQEHYDMGWLYGEVLKEEREFLRFHKDMIPEFIVEDGIVSLEAAKKNYHRLEKGEQDKDIEAMECMLAMLRVFDGVRIYRL